MKSLGHMTLVKVTKSIIIEGNVSEVILNRFYGRFHSIEVLKNQDNEIIEGEIIESYIDSMILMGETENQDEFMSLKNKNKLHVVTSYAFKNNKQVNIDDLIILDVKSDYFYSIVKLNNQFLLCNFESRECILQEKEFFTLNLLEDYLIANFPNYSLLAKNK